jgi:hypothetical protein
MAFAIAHALIDEVKDPADHVHDWLNSRSSSFRDLAPYFEHARRLLAGGLP